MRASQRQGRIFDGLVTHLLGGLLAFVCGAGCSPDSPRPNLIVIVIDTLRPDHLELYGYERPTAPFLARL